jgi:hypothetical protein
MEAPVRKLGLTDNERARFHSTASASVAKKQDRIGYFAGYYTTFSGQEQGAIVRVCLFLAFT